MKKILIIGLSSGSWVRALSYSKNIEKIDVIEINHGYLDLINQYSCFGLLLLVSEELAEPLSLLRLVPGIVTVIPRRLKYGNFVFVSKIVKIDLFQCF